MTFQIPIDLETTIRSAVQGGRFASVDEAMTEAARLLVREHKIEPVTDQVDAIDPDHDPILGLFKDDAELMDQIVADIYTRRNAEAEAMRVIDVE